MRINISILFSFVLIVACAHQPVAPTEPMPKVGMTEDAFFSAQKARLAATTKVQSKIHFKLKSPKDSVFGSGRIVFVAPERFRMDLRDPIGRVQFQISMKDRAFTALYPSRQTAYLDDAAGAEYAKRFLGFPTSIADLAFLLLGEIPPSWSLDGFESWVWDGQGKFYVGTSELPVGKLVVKIEPQTATIRRVQLTSARGKDVQIEYTDFSKCCGQVAMAHQVELRLAQGRVLVLEWDDIKDAVGLAENIFSTEVPAGLRRVTLNTPRELEQKP